MDESVSKRQIKGRGSNLNPGNRFDKIDIVLDEDEINNGRVNKTVFYRDSSKSIITYNDSPDIGMNASINPYRGCEHGCIYCYARPTHEFLGLSAGLDFETKIFVKENAPVLLRKELSSRSWKPQPIMLSGNTDCYQPAERHFKITRSCLEVMAEFRNPVGIVTKNRLIIRDIDVLQDMVSFNCASVAISVTTLDSTLANIMEPRTSQPNVRIDTIRKLSEAGIPVMVLIAPVIPGLTDHEIPGIIKQVVDAGAIKVGYVMLRLPYGVKDLFQDWLERHFPNKVNKVIHRIQSVREGGLNSANFGERMRGTGIFAKQVEDMFKVACRKHGIYSNKIELTTEYFRRSVKNQLNLF